MKQTFIEKKFSQSSRVLIKQINVILDRYEKQGYDLSLRQLYYQLVSSNIVPNSQRSYKNVGALVSDARLAGQIDWLMITDRGREMYQNAHWLDPKNFVEETANQFKIDHWLDQDNYVEVMVEKQALEGVLLPVCHRYDVPFTSNKGYSSSSAMFEAGRRMQARWREGKNVVVIYLGDHDPSGIDMSRDVSERLTMFSGVPEHDSITVNRVALNMNQVRELNPPENPAKITDSRFQSYLSKFGESSWELDAIEPAQLSGIVSDAIEKLLDMEKFQACADLQEAGREKLIKHAEKL
jgi:hypothetical protein